MRSSPHQLLLRAAVWLKDHYQQIALPHTFPSLPHHAWNRLQCLEHRLTLATRHPLPATRRTLLLQMHNAMEDLIRECSQLRASLQRPRPQSPSLRLLYEELVSLSEEFDHVRLDWPDKTLSVQTARIQLGGIDLGPFEIRLFLQEIGTSSPYAVVALDPNPCSENEEIPHPHVQGTSLCEGEGRHAIARALEEGRIGEFFLLVAQVLRTYNASSPYQPLSQWFSTPCPECGDSVAEEDLCRCECCPSRLCDSCLQTCAGCEVNLCSDCTHRCEACDAMCCDECMSQCASCKDAICRHCQIDDCCFSCSQLSEESSNEARPTESLSTSSTTESLPATPSSHPDVHPDRVGEATVSA